MTSLLTFGRHSAGCHLNGRNNLVVGATAADIALEARA